MNSLRFYSAIFLAIFIIFSAQEVFPHGGAHEPEETKAEEAARPAADTLYSAGENEADPLSDPDNLFSPTDLFTNDELVSPDPMPGIKMEGSHKNNMEHQEPQVELSHHKRVSSSSKGFGVAVGITIFAGIAFAGLSFMRPGE